MRLLLIISLATALFASGCTFMLGKQKFRLVPGTGVAPRIVENGDGEQIYIERPAPEGDTFFIFFRGQL